MDPWKKKANIIYSGDSLKDKREQNQLFLDSAKPQMEELFQHHSNQKVSIALFDSNGIMIENLSDETLARKMGKYRFFPGSGLVGTVMGEERMRLELH